MRFAAAVLAALLAFPASGEDLQAAAERAATEIAAALQRSPERAALKRIAVAPFLEAGAAKGLGAAAQAAAAARLGTALQGVDVVDPQKLQALLGEQKLEAMLGSDRTAPSPALADRAGAQALLSGEVRDAGDRLVLQVRLASAAGKVLAQFQGNADLPPRPGKRAGVESARIDVAMRKLSDGLAAGFARLPGSARYRRLAVLAFSEAGPEAERRKIGQIVTAEIATNLRRDHGLLLVERTKLGEVLGELKVRQMLAVDAAQAGQIGKMADAQALVIGQVSEAGDRFLVNARIVATETGESLAAESASIAAAGMVAFASDAVVLRSRSDALFRSLLVPGLGQLYNRQPVKAWVVIGAEAAIFGTALGYHLSASNAYDEYRDVRPSAGVSASAEAERLYDLAASRYRTRNTLLVAGGVVWLANVVDAWMSGVDGQDLLSGGVAAARSVEPAVSPLAGGLAASVTLRF